MALLQSVADCLTKEAERRKTGVEKVKDFVRRVNWLKIGKILAPAATGAVLGGAIAGPFGAILGAVNGLIQKGQNATEDDYKKVSDACGELNPSLSGLVGAKAETSLPKEIDALRQAFEAALEELNIKLVVLVDDLDRCLPDTAIATLEAMRLLLLLPRTAFIIAADEEMIRQAVRHHFGQIEISDDLVTSYFDKLIQIPLRVPRLGHAEVKGYLVLLYAELEVKRGRLSQVDYLKAKEQILMSVKQSWGAGLTNSSIREAFKDSLDVMETLINLSDQIAGILTTAKQISGNPRLIKRFLNDLNIRKTIADSEGLTLAYEGLLKLQLFERCVSSAAFEFLVSEANKSEEGKPAFLSILESSLADGGDYKEPTESWKDEFIEAWMKLDPPLSNIDLRPILNLSRTQASATVRYDKLSQQALEILEAISTSKDIEQFIVKKIVIIGKTEAEQILVRLCRKARAEQITTESILRAMNVTEAFPELSGMIVTLLSEIAPKARKAPLVPRLKNKQWASPVLAKWLADVNTPGPVKKAIETK
jgi:predicted KAP-like P-loop ATPase